MGTHHRQMEMVQPKTKNDAKDVLNPLIKASSTSFSGPYVTKNVAHDQITEANLEIGVARLGF